MVSVLLLAALPFAAALPHSYSASIFYFPDAAEVGFAGPTPTGAEPEAIQTAPAAPVKSDTYPLVADGAAYSPSFNPMRYWGNLSPWFSVGGAFGLPEASPQVPSGCELTQAHIVQRHGARYPTSGTNKFAALLQNAVVNRPDSPPRVPSLGAEILTPFGRKQLYDLYGHLLSGFTQLPVFRTTSEWRMVQSARNWAAGFFGLEEYPTSYYEEIIIEEDGYNNTLVPWNDCANANGDLYEMGSWYANNWTEIYLKGAVERLQQYVDGVELTTTYVSEMQDLCAYETVSIGYSKFCDLFTEEEWKGYQYANDLDFWYADGPGTLPLLARLTQTPMTLFDTTTNGTLDGNNITFPLNQPIYMDATHDTNIASIAVAMNFTSMVASGPLPVDHIPLDLSYNTQHIAPFAAHLVGQVMTCPVTDSPSGSEKYIRWLLNDGAVPLTGIKYCEEPNKDGLCLLGNFIKGMQERVAEVDFQYDCFGDVSVPYPDNLTNGRYIR
ncbi:histidine phosphatase superfamily [Fomitopsis serialis]|uniref:histidine phosphatase superfamily n=1 Tax=Fomitopsis serialis TaxID=139415 RepID=UPI0020076E33|nr:histidine phosphatase superfamily [Neoantrodia serialis]KAH9916035.1 histidine phosphatase superfamily [Neoantrodia serialis]